MVVDNQRLHAFEQSLLSLDRISAKALLTQEIETGGSNRMIESLIVPVLEKIGHDWEQGGVALSQVYMSGRICEELVDLLLFPGEVGFRNHPHMAIAVLQDFHMLGKRIVYSVLRAGGYFVLDYGHVEIDELVERVRSDGIEILFLSTLMLPAALSVKTVKEKFEHVGHAVKIAVGGAPFRLDEDLWRAVGADAMGKSASDALAIVSRLTGEMQ